MVELLSPLEPVYRTGTHGDLTDGTGVVLSETQPGSIVQVAAWPGAEDAMLAALNKVTGLDLASTSGAGVATAENAAFGIARGKWLAVGQAEGLAARLLAAVDMHAVGVVTDLSHGRTAIRIAGAKAEWVLAKFYAIDFAIEAFGVGAGRSTTHHDIFTLIQRTGADQFDLYVYRSFARSFWTALCHASEEVGYEVN